MSTRCLPTSAASLQERRPASPPAPRRRALQTLSLGLLLGCGLLSSTLASGHASPPPSSFMTGPNASLGGWRPFPERAAWNQPIESAPVDPRSDAIIDRIGRSKPLHADFGASWEGGPFGIGYIVVPPDQDLVTVHFTEYPRESDRGPYPVPADAPIERGSDRHVLVVDPTHQKLYELYHAERGTDEAGHPTWRAGSGAIFDAATGHPRPAGWTSADAAGLSIFAGLVRYDEVVERGAIKHALRFTVERTRRAYVAPASHLASSDDDPTLPPMGMRVRLKAGFDISGYPPQARVVLLALKRYGMIVADNGSDWFISGAPDARWNDDALNTLKRVRGRDFEVVKMGEVHTR